MSNLFKTAQLCGSKWWTEQFWHMLYEAFEPAKSNSYCINHGYEWLIISYAGLFWSTIVVNTNLPYTRATDFFRIIFCLMYPMKHSHLWKKKLSQMNMYIYDIITWHITALTNDHWTNLQCDLFTHPSPNLTDFDVRPKQYLNNNESCQNARMPFIDCNDIRHRHHWANWFFRDPLHTIENTTGL